MITNAKPSIFPVILSRSDRKGLHPASRRLKTSIQTRKLWRAAGQAQESYKNRGQKRMKIYRRFDLIRMWGRPSHPWPAQLYNRHHRWWDWEKSWERPKANSPQHKRGIYPQTDFWGDEGARIQKRLAQIKKEIEADPYGTLFGRRLEPFNALNKFEDTCTSLYRSLFGLEKSKKTESTDTTARSKPSKNDSTESPERKSPPSRKPGNGVAAATPQKVNTSRYEFDPISGRMILKKPRSTDATTEKGPAGEGDSGTKSTTDPEACRKRAGYLSSIDRTSIKPKAAPVTSVNLDGSDCSPLDSKVEKNADSQSGPEGTSLSSCKQESGLSGFPREDTGLGNAIKSSENEFDYHKSSSEIPIDTDNSQNVEPNRPWSPSAPSQNGLSQGNSTYSKPGYLGANNSKDAKEKAEDLDLLQASYIRSHYDYGNFDKDSKMQNQMKKESDEASNLSADSVSDIDVQDLRKRYETREQKQHLDTVTSGSNTSSQGASKGTAEPQHSEKFDHTQSSSLGHPQFAETYQVLAYDPSTLQVTNAEARTSLHRMDKCHHPSEILSRLNNPAKFLPFFERMHADGYEISSGGGDILVFRKSFNKQGYTGASLGQLANEAQEVKAQLRNEPLLNEESMGELKSVAGQYPKHDINDAGPAELSRPSASNAGGPNSKADSSKGESKIGSAARRMFISGAATAATCYAIGVVVEYFRTGGQDGLGIDAFTEFESERRRRDMEQTR